MGRSTWDPIYQHVGLAKLKNEQLEGFGTNGQTMMFDQQTRGLKIYENKVPQPEYNMACNQQYDLGTSTNWWYPPKWLIHWKL